jgi:hypothetical protein
MWDGFRAATPIHDLDRAESFLLRCVRRGLAHSRDSASRHWVAPQPEVTGQLLSYFAARTERAWPQEIARGALRLYRLQHRGGGFSGPTRRGPLRTFDTAQILHGFAAWHRRTGAGAYLAAARRCADFVCDMQDPDGSMFPIYDERLRERRVDRSVDAAIQTRNIDGLLLVAELCGESRYLEAATRLADFGREHCDLTYTHQGACALEGLLAFGDKDFVRERLVREVVPRVGPNGFLACAEHLPHADVSGSVQLAILLGKTGLREPAGRILDWARGVQARDPSGGLFRSAGRDGTPDTTEICPRATKYYCELARWWRDSGGD